MTPFEHIMVIGSIVLGLAIAQLLTGLADSLRMDKSVKLYWPHTLWVVCMIMACIQWGFGVWVLEARPRWTGPELSLFIITPILVFLVARFMYPAPIDSVSLKTHYYESRRYTYGLATGIFCLSIVANIVLRDLQVMASENITVVVMSAILLVLTVSCNEIVHKVLVPILLLMATMIMVLTRIESA